MFELNLLWVFTEVRFRNPKRTFVVLGCYDRRITFAIVKSDPHLGNNGVVEITFIGMSGVSAVFDFFSDNAFFWDRA